MPYNIILIEDDEIQRDELTEALEDDDEFGSHSVKVFRDLVTFEDAVNEEALIFEEEQPLLVILDIMIARELREHDRFAPRWMGDEPLTEEERCHYVDDELGLGIGTDIRDGKYTTIVPKDTPILFFTARQNTRVKEAIEKIKRSDLLVKPQFSRHIQKTIDNLMGNRGVDTTGGNDE